MNHSHDWNEPPTAEQLAAYADGELDGRDALRPLHERIDAWLIDHPEARAEVERLQELRRLCAATAPPEPDDAAWDRVLAALPTSPRKTRFPLPLSWVAAILVTAGLGWGLWNSLQPTPTPPVVAVVPENGESDFDEPLIVATADEIEILRVEGADTQTLAVTNLPTGRPMEWLRHGEVVVTRQAPQVRVEGHGRPMIVMGEE